MTMLWGLSDIVSRPYTTPNNHKDVSFLVFTIGADGLSKCKSVRLFNLWFCESAGTDLNWSHLHDTIAERKVCPWVIQQPFSRYR